MIDRKPRNELTTSADKPARTPRVSLKIRQVVELLVTGTCKTQKAAAERIGLHPDYVCRELKKPQVRVLIDRRVRETIANGTMRASARLLELVDAGSEHVSLDATKHVLALEGIKPTAEPTTNVNINIRAGYIIDLSDDPPAKTIDATPANIAHKTPT